MFQHVIIEIYANFGAEESTIYLFREKEGNFRPSS